MVGRRGGSTRRPTTKVCGGCCNALLGGAPPRCSVAQHFAIRTQCSEGIVDAELTARSSDPGGHTFAKWGANDAMGARWCVHFLNTLESAGTEAPFKARECWPQSTVDERHLAQDEPTDEDVSRATDLPSEREELMTSRLTPPASSRLPPEGGAHQARNGSATGLEHDAMVSDEAKRLCRSHGYMRDSIASPESVASA